MLKYYFGYHKLFGAPFPICWVEDDGVPVGGTMECLPDNKHEITWKEFTYTALFALKDKYPYKEAKFE